MYVIIKWNRQIYILNAFVFCLLYYCLFLCELFLHNAYACTLNGNIYFLIAIKVLDKYKIYMKNIYLDQINLNSSAPVNIYWSAALFTVLIKEILNINFKRKSEKAKEINWFVCIKLFMPDEMSGFTIFQLFFYTIN